MQIVRTNFFLGLQLALMPISCLGIYKEAFSATFAKICSCCRHCCQQKEKNPTALVPVLVEGKWRSIVPLYWGEREKRKRGLVGGEHDDCSYGLPIEPYSFLGGCSFGIVPRTASVLKKHHQVMNSVNRKTCVLCEDEVGQLGLACKMPTSQTPSDAFLEPSSRTLV